VFNIIKKLSILNANVLHYALFSGSSQSLEELCSMIELIDKSPKDVDLFNCRTLDNQTPVVFLASHSLLELPSLENPMCELEKTVNDLINKFTKTITKLQEQILLTFDIVARRCRLKRFNQLKILVKKSSMSTRKQVVHLACRYNNETFLEWLLDQDELKGFRNTYNDVGFTPLLTATFYNSQKCVEKLLGKNVSLLLTVIYIYFIEFNCRTFD
jgi:hypothetical protein